jgi:hypothetical protein
VGVALVTLDLWKPIRGRNDTAPLEHDDADFLFI